MAGTSPRLSGSRSIQRRRVSVCTQSLHCRHGRACHGHPRVLWRQAKTWMPVTSTGMTILGDGSREETQPDSLNRTALMVVPRHLYGSVALSQLRIEIVPIGIVRDDETDLPCARPVFHGRPLCPSGAPKELQRWGASLRNGESWIAACGPSLDGVLEAIEGTGMQFSDRDDIPATLRWE